MRKWDKWKWTTTTTRVIPRSLADGRRQKCQDLNLGINTRTTQIECHHFPHHHKVWKILIVPFINVMIFPSMLNTALIRPQSYEKNWNVFHKHENMSFFNTCAHKCCNILSIFYLKYNRFKLYKWKRMLDNNIFPKCFVLDFCYFKELAGHWATIMNCWHNCIN